MSINTSLDRRKFVQTMFGTVGAITVLESQVASASLETRKIATQDSSIGSGLLDVSANDESFWKLVRSMYPLDRSLIYMNNGGLGPSPISVVERVNQVTRELEFSCSEGHDRLETIRRNVSGFLGCDINELGFTRSTTEGMNLIARGLTLNAGDEVIMSTHEHPGGSMIWVLLGKEIGLRVKLFEPTDTAEGNLEAISDLLSPRTKVVSLSHITCTTGLRFPIGQIATICRERGIVFVVDGAHPPGMIDVNLHELGCDFYVCSGHKWLSGPKGTGLIYIRNQVRERWSPSFVGAYTDFHYSLFEQEFVPLPDSRVVEYGTRNVALLEGLSAAIDFKKMIGVGRIEQRGIVLANKVKESLLSIDGVKVLTPSDPDNSSSIVTFQFLNERYDPLKIFELLLKKHRIRLRPVLEHGLNALRISLGSHNSIEECETLMLALKEELK